MRMNPSTSQWTKIIDTNQFHHIFCDLNLKIVLNNKKTAVLVPYIYIPLLFHTFIK